MPDTNNESVVKDIGVTHIGATTGQEEDKPLPESTEGEKTKEEDAESEATEESEEESEEEIIEEDKAEEGEKPPAPVEGETPKETALRLETERLRGLLRDKMKDEVLSPAERAKIVDTLTEDDKKELAKYKPDELANAENLLKILAKKEGLVRKDEISTNALSDSFDSWLGEHKEYFPENDKGGILFNRFKEEYKLYRQPASTRELTKILNKVHEAIFKISPASSKKEIAARSEKIGAASHSGKVGQSGVARNTPDARIPEDMKSHLKGFSDEELAEM